jgi:hypothetical protein
VHDIVDLESRGVPGVFVASTEFITAAASQAVALGFPAASVFVTHPIQDRDDDEIRSLADGALDEILAALVAEADVDGGGEAKGRPVAQSS